MKLLSFAIPCYNSKDYMEHCIESILPGGDDVEIIIVDDGSKDETAAIADRYAAEYPGIVKAVHQENGGHGEAVNTGLKNATGKYFKVVDSDDWVDLESYKKILDKLREFEQENTQIDMLLANYVYEKEGAKRKKVMRQTGFPRNEIFTWSDIKHIHKGHYILMHSVIYRTELLRSCGLKLPKHTFYVDNIYVYKPLPYVRTMYYLDVDFYRYFIGRDDQSVNEQVMIRRIDQQIRVNKIMFDDVKLHEITNEMCRKYMYSYLEIITTISTILAIISGTDENMAKKDELWAYMKEHDEEIYKKLRHGVMGQLMNLPGKGGRKVAIGAYKLSTEGCWIQLDGCEIRSIIWMKIYKQIVNISKKYKYKKVVLFGSRARGTNHPKSDIDLAIYGCEDFGDLSDCLNEELWSLLKLDIINMDDKHISPVLVTEIERDGRVLYEKI
mgnify:CR=1 FL=1